MAVVTNDIYTKEDAEFLIRQGTLPAGRVLGVETGGCPHAAIREDASMNLEAIAELESAHPGLELIFVESGGDNLAAAFSPELVDAFIYVIDVSGGDKIPRKGGPGIKRSGLGLAKCIVDDFGDFDPAKPDAVATFQMPASPVNSITKPLGN